MIYEIGTRVMTPDGPGVVEFITKRGMPKMGFTVKLDRPFKEEESGELIHAVHYPHNMVDPE